VLIEQDIDKANAFNEYFAAQSTLDLLLEPTIDSFEPQLSSENLPEIVKSQEAIFKNIKFTEYRKSYGS